MSAEIGIVVGVVQAVPVNLAGFFPSRHVSAGTDEVVVCSQCASCQVFFIPHVVVA